MKIYLFIFLSLFIIFASCKKREEKNCYDICDAPDKQFFDSYQNWIPYKNYDTISFKHSGGKMEATFKANRWKDVKNYYQVKTCCGEFDGFTPLKTLVFSSQQITLPITINYGKAFGTDSAMLERGDLVMAAIGNSAFYIQTHPELNNSTIVSKSILLDTLTIGNVQYTEVYHTNNHFYQDERVLYVKGIYFTKKHGLIGFYYNNNEKWEIKN